MLGDPDNLRDKLEKLLQQETMRLQWQHVDG